MVKIPFQVLKGFRLQYTDAAQGQVEALVEPSSAAVFETLSRIASTDPYAYGVPLDGVKDRRRVQAGGMTVIFWVSPEVGVITVVSVAAGQGVLFAKPAEVPASA